ncbi:hypothetical protein FNF31_07020 [Cafeteria roenbergensis]|uniref:Uncharacterized protein n=1 Tax=Cafeteria roenbergensis TaxID=33653 RepID=A0A5A8CEL7_CAFRO|nr:hypothetical protein FNF31_07020 [Cafeteria roenbergensis]KAA0161639.1 hypothetical protein FNF28_04988 [Cafeteria roenbergensis]
MRGAVPTSLARRTRAAGSGARHLAQWASGGQRAVAARLSQSLRQRAAPTAAPAAGGSSARWVSGSPRPRDVEQGAGGAAAARDAQAQADAVATEDDPFRRGWELVSSLLESARTPGHQLDAAANLTAPTLRALCHQLGFVDEAARRQTSKSRPPRGRANRTTADAKQAGIIVQLCNQATLAGQVWPSLLAFVVAQRGTSSRAIWRSVQAVLHSSAQAAEAVAAGADLATAGLATDASGVFGPRPAELESLFAAMPPHGAVAAAAKLLAEDASAADPATAAAASLFEQADAAAEPSPALVSKADQGRVASLWQVEREVARLRRALAGVIAAPEADGALPESLVTSLGVAPERAAELLLGIGEACVTAAAVATAPQGDAAAAAQVPPGAVAALLRLQVAAGHGDRAEASLSRAHDAGMLLQMRHYEPVLRLRASQRRLREAVGLLLAMHERGVTANPEVCDEAYALVVRCAALSLAPDALETAAEGENAGPMELPALLVSIASAVDGQGAAVLSAAQAETVALSLLRHAEGVVSHPGAVLLAEIERLFASEPMRARGWRLARSDIGSDGRCSASGHSLARRQLEGGVLYDATSLIRQVVVEHEGAQAAKLAARAGGSGRRGGKRAAAGQGSGAGQGGPASVLGALDRHIARHGPFDMVIDGANLGLFRRSVQGGYLSYNQLDAIVQHAAANGLRPLIVLHSRWMRPMDLVPDTGKAPGARGGKRGGRGAGFSKTDVAAGMGGDGSSAAQRAREEGRREMVAVLGRWRRDCPQALFVVPRGNDDIYWMYAAMQSQRLKIRQNAGELPSLPEARQAVIDEVAAESGEGRAADEAAVAAATSPAALEASGAHPMAPHNSVWLVTNDFMRDHKGELLGWQGFSAWRAGIVKAIIDRHPRWYSAGADRFDQLLEDLRAGRSPSAPPPGLLAAEADGYSTETRLQRAAVGAFRRSGGSLPGESGDPSAPPTAGGLGLAAAAAAGSAAAGSDAAAAAEGSAARAGWSVAEAGAAQAAAPASAPLSAAEAEREAEAVTAARQVGPQHGAAALCQAARDVFLVLPHPFALRFHSPDGGNSAFFFPGFPRSVEDAGGVPDMPQSAEQSGAAAETSVSVDTAFERVVRRSSPRPLAEILPAGSNDAAATPSGPMRWQDDAPSSPRSFAVLPPTRPWFVLYRENQPAEASADQDHSGRA